MEKWRWYSWQFSLSGCFFIRREIARILFVRVLETAQAERSARVLPRLTLTIPMETKLGQLLPQLRRGCLSERNPNPSADNLGEIEQTRIAGFQKLQNFRDRQCPVLFPCLAINGQAIVRLGCWRCRCGGVLVCAAQLCGSAPEPDLFFCICFHGLFFSALLCVFCPSPFMRKRKPQPSPVGVTFRGHHERAGWFWLTP